MIRLTCLLILAAIATPSASAFEDTRVFEMRTYFANEGKLDDLQARFRDHTVELFEKHGMTNVGYWVPEENKDNTLVYILAYPNMEAREKSWQGFLADADWKAAYKASIADGKLVGKIESVYMKPTDYSPEIKPSVAKSPRLFELRIYTTRPGKLDALNSRFRDHTTKLFRKHGLSQFGYWVPTQEKDGAANKLIYLLAHPSKESRQAGFKAFGQDPDWTSARAASEANGPLMIKKGVSSQFLVPTDFSATR